MPISDTHLRYLFAICDLAAAGPRVSSMEVATALGVTKPSVTRALKSLAARDLVVKEYYGKIYLTDRGAFTARYYRELLGIALNGFPDFGFGMTADQKHAAALALVAALPEAEYLRRYQDLFDTLPPQDPGADA